jgi:hypothetical protein
MSDSATTTYIIRVEGTAGRYGLGEEVAKNCYLFKDGHYDLDAEQLAQAIKGTAPQRQRREPRR